MWDTLAGTLFGQSVDGGHVIGSEDLELTLGEGVVVAALAYHLLDLCIGYFTADKLVDVDRHTY